MRTPGQGGGGTRVRWLSEGVGGEVRRGLSTLRGCGEGRGGEQEEHGTRKAGQVGGTVRRALGALLKSCG